MSTLSVDTIQGQTTASTVKIPGHVIQVVQKLDTAPTTFSNSGSTATFVTCGSLTQSFTPKFSTSKILLQASLGHVASNTADRFAYFKFTGGNTTSSLGDALGDRSRIHAFHYFAHGQDGTSIYFQQLDSPNTTSQVTYQIYIRKVSGSGSSIIGNNTDISSLQAIEIGA